MLSKAVMLEVYYVAVVLMSIPYACMHTVMRRFRNVTYSCMKTTGVDVKYIFQFIACKIFYICLVYFAKNVLKSCLVSVN